MKICPICGHRDNPFWRFSRFDYNTEYMEEVEFMREYPEIWKLLDGKKTFDTIGHGGLLYYRRGKTAKYVYRVLPEEYKTPRK